MKTADDLSRSMHAHMDGLDDIELSGRATAVHQRVRVIRRRRAASVAGAAALAVVGAVGIGVVGMPDRDGEQPALLGIPVPQELESLGFSYEYDDGRAEADEPTVSIRLESADQPRLVSWATAGDDQVVTVKAGGVPFTSDRPDFGDFVLVEPGETTRVTVTAEDPGVALAVFNLGTDRPAGVTAHGVTWRQDVAGDRLVDGVVGEPGDAEVRTTVTLPKGRLVFGGFCAGVPDPGGDRSGVRLTDYDMEWSVEGKATSAASCDPGRAPWDPGALGGWSRDRPVDGITVAGRHYRPGEEVTVTLRVLRNGEPVAHPDLRIGLGLYVESPDSVEVAGSRLPRVIEAAGHRWHVLTHRTTRLIPREPWSVPVPESDDRLLPVTVFDTGGRNMGFAELVDGEVVSSVVAPPGGYSTYDHVPLAPGVETVGLRSRGEADVGIVFYELGD